MICKKKRAIVTHRQNVAVNSNFLRMLHNSGPRHNTNRCSDVVCWNSKLNTEKRMVFVSHFTKVVPIHTQCQRAS